MATTLTKGGVTLTLSDELLWPDEFSWSSVQSTTTYSAAGAPLFDRGVKLAGRLITLQAGPTWGWTTRAQALTLYAWVNDAGAALSLLYRGIAYSVVFDYERGALEAAAVGDGYQDPDAADFYAVTLRFITTA